MPIPKEILGDIRFQWINAIDAHAPINGPHEGYAVILEELEEAWDAIKHDDPQQAYTEITHVAAMCIRFLIDLYPRSSQQTSQETKTLEKE